MRDARARLGVAGPILRGSAPVVAPDEGPGGGGQGSGIRRRKGLGFALCAVVLALVAGFALTPVVRAAEVMKSFTATYAIQPDGSIDVVELIAWDFGVVPRHGIFRDLIDRRECSPVIPGDPVRVHPCKGGYDRVWKYDIESVEIAEGASGAFSDVEYGKNRNGDAVQLKIGDPDRTIAGLWTYRIRYTIRGALDAYEDHDELYWNATGTWPVAIERALATVTLPGGAAPQTRCFQGFGSSDRAGDPCSADSAPGASATFRSAESIQRGNQMTIVVGWEKGLVKVVPPILDYRGYFHFDALEFGGAALMGILGLVGVVGAWWRSGRDRRYRSIYYLTNDPTQESKPVFGKDNVVVEFLPPQDLRPAQMGLILDERADPLDVTATIIDLAVRGYLHITETERKAWKLQRLDKPADDLMPYEATILNGISTSRKEVYLSELKDKFHTHLATAQEELYGDAQARHWFPRHPKASKGLWAGAGVGLAVLGGLATVGLALTINRALIGIPIVVAGLLLLLVSPAMSRRTADGSEALRRVLGFRLYIATAEKYPQRFNEEQNIFAKYLPYAIVFQCVNKWAKAFEGLDGNPATDTSAWYAGATAFSVASFSSNMNSFSNSVGSTIVSTPSSGGSGSGFSGGGFSGGGGGGGGGGSW